MKRIYLTLISLLISTFSFAAIGPIEGDSIMCVMPAGYGYTFFDTTLGGMWSSSNSVVGSIDASTGDFFPSSAGTTTITYTVGTSFVTRLVTVYPAPAPIHVIKHAECIGSVAILGDTTSGGGWWSTDGSVDLLMVMHDTAYIRVNSVIGGVAVFTDTNGCIATLSLGAAPAPPSITGTTTIHVGTTTTLSNAWAGGKWSTSNPAVAAIDSVSGIVNGVSVGTATIYYRNPCTTSTIMTILPPVGVSDPIPYAEINVYPNPAKQILTVSAIAIINSAVITNLIGQVVYTREVNANSLQIDISTLQKGIYFLRINGSEIRRFVKD